MTNTGYIIGLLIVAAVLAILAMVGQPTDLGL